MNIRRFVVLLAVVVVGGAGFVNGSASAEDDPPPTINFTFTIDGEQPDYDFDVYLSPLGGGPTTKLDGDDIDTPGTYVGSGTGAPLQPGDYLVRVLADADFAGRFLYWAFPTVLAPGENLLPTIDIQPPPYGRLKGTIKSPQGTLLKGIQIELFSAFPEVTVREQTAGVSEGRYGFVFDDYITTITGGAKIPVIRPHFGKREKTTQIEPVAVYPTLNVVGKMKKHWVYAPRPRLKINGHYPRSFDSNPPFILNESKHSTVKVKRVDGKVKMTLIGNTKSR